MNSLSIDFNNITGKIKPMHATNNGPIKGVGFGGAKVGAFQLWEEAGIPYARTHDSSSCASYGGEHTVDIYAVFPNFDADVEDPASYDFAVTDAYIANIQACGSETFYRLGSKIEHRVKKYNIHPPKDFKKWAQICEHVIMHYNYGWADGFNYNMKYWEIWNEPDLDPEDSEKRRTWTGTILQFYEFYKTVATHLKSKFPELKIGGPASAYVPKWIEGFLEYLTKDGEKTPLDFFSWHCYGFEVEKMYKRSEYVRDLLDKFGYTQTESILNEWNYIKSWSEFVYSVKHIISIKGAAFSAACMCGCQNNTAIDMLMYYDARPCRYNGLFDFYTNAPLKGYYSFKMFNELYKLGGACKCSTDAENIYVCAAKGDDCAVMLSYYTDNDECDEIKHIKLDFTGGADKYDVYLLDKDHDDECVGTVNNGEQIAVSPNTVVLLKSVAN